jgi:hypothetical protein
MPAPPNQMDYGEGYWAGIWGIIKDERPTTQLKAALRVGRTWFFWRMGWGALSVTHARLPCRSWLARMCACMWRDQQRQRVPIEPCAGRMRP